MDLEEKGCWRYIYLEKNTRREENMTEWRLRECPAYADTYIEWRFECRCKELKDGVNILTEWRDTKRQCISILEGTMFDFQHFSRHDASHSINILEAVEMLLGKDRIDLLSVGDLWMLLECAYIHDVGMSLTFDELAALWEEPEFKEHIQKAIAGEKDNQAAAAAYLRVDNLIRDRKLEGLESYIHDKGDPLEALTAAWPIELERGVAEIIADYIRERHPNRVVNAMRKMDAKKESAIPERLYKMMSLACEMHGHDFSDIQKEMKYCTKGFGNTVIHPMFAAAMLRMGDLLDMDNNRFHVRALEHFGTLPHTSMLHYNKHKAMTHIAIRREGIEAEAVSDDMETCKVINSWFESVKRETNHLICAWNDIVPPELFGCYLKVSKCQVFYENHKQKNMFQAKADTEFSVDKSKLIKLLMGTNIYYSKIDFLREYLQNALDASKMKLWLDLKADAYRFSDEFSQKETLTEIAPFDIGKSIYDRYTIEIGVDIDRGRQKIELSISDKGIGIEKDCIDVVSCVGSGWRKRKKYQDDIRKMPQWMRPTGGFGVGIQSAFMITDEVRISTRGVDENEGTKLILKKPENGGNVSQESWMNGQAGTTVEMSIDINCFREIAKEFTDENKYNSIASSVAPECDFFDAAWTLDYVYGLLKKYIETIFPNTPIPMRIIKNKKDRYAETALCITSFPDFMFNGVEFRSESFITKKIELNK